MHTVRSSFYPAKPVADAFKVLVSVNDVLLVSSAELCKRYIYWDIVLAAEFQERTAFVARRLGTPGFNGIVLQTLARIGNDQVKMVR